MEFYSTRDVARKLGILPGTLTRAVWLGHCPAPKKSPGGAFLWTEQDIERAAWALHRTGELKKGGLENG